VVWGLGVGGGVGLDSQHARGLGGVALSRPAAATQTHALKPLTSETAAAGRPRSRERAQQHSHTAAAAPCCFVGHMSRPMQGREARSSEHAAEQRGMSCAVVSSSHYYTTYHDRCHAAHLLLPAVCGVDDPLAPAATPLRVLSRLLSPLPMPPAPRPPDLLICCIF